MDIENLGGPIGKAELKLIPNFWAANVNFTQNQRVKRPLARFTFIHISCCFYQRRWNASQIRSIETVGSETGHGISSKRKIHKNHILEFQLEESIMNVRAIALLSY